MITSDSEFLSFAVNKYDNRESTSIEEFESDLKRFTYLNSLLNRYRFNKLDLKDRLITNHLVILSNCFTVIGSMAMLKYKIIEENTLILETFYHYLGHFVQTDAKIDFYLLDILNDY